MFDGRVPLLLSSAVAESLYTTTIALVLPQISQVGQVNDLSYSAGVGRSPTYEILPEIDD